MAQETWNTVDAYLGGLFAPQDDVLVAAQRDSEAAGLPSISVSATHGQLLHVLALAQRARRILEVGTLGGYSAICMARALPEDGRLVTLEYSPVHAEVARANIARAGLADRVDVRVGAALETLPVLAAEDDTPFDLVFVDADKQNNSEYLRWALKLSRPGTLIVLDNVVRGGGVAEPTGGDEAMEGTRRALEYLSQEPRLTATAVQTVGAKGYDGFALAWVNG